MKCPPTSDQATFLNKTFKFFDIQNKGGVNQDQFKRAIEKLGVVVPDNANMDTIFGFYDRSGDGIIDFKEFTAIFISGGSDGQPKPAEATRQYRMA